MQGASLLSLNMASKERECLCKHPFLFLLPQHAQFAPTCVFAFYCCLQCTSTFSESVSQPLGKALNKSQVKQVIPGENPHPTLELWVLWHQVPSTYLAGQVMVPHFYAQVPI